MKAKFGIERERHNKLFYKEYNNDKGIFHFHSQIELYFVTGGEMEIYVGNQGRCVKAGEMSVALSYEPHSYKTPVESTSKVFIIPAYLCEEFINLIGNKRATNPFITDKETVALIGSMVDEARNASNEIKKTGYIYVILGLLMDYICLEVKDAPLDTELSSRILFYINENFREDISLTSIASHFGYNASYISKYFKTSFNIGINQYLTVIRLKNVLMLMHEKKHTFTYCAFESGFNSMRTFYRVFYNELGCSPGEYMKNM